MQSLCGLFEFSLCSLLLKWIIQALNRMKCSWLWLDQNFLLVTNLALEVIVNMMETLGKLTDGN